MRWRAGGQYYIESDLGYRVCKGYAHGAWWYLAYTPAREILGDRRASSEIAKSECEEHARVQQRRMAG